jgi:DNA-binding PadR family transcriptional regulator
VAVRRYEKFAPLTPNRVEPIAGGLTVSEYAVLGLLGFGEKSGYELHRFAERSVGFIWTPAKSQIYKVLPRLAERGLAAVRPIPQERLPDKQLYRPTGAGRKLLRTWLASVDEAQPADVSLLKIFFGGQASGGALVRQVAAYHVAREQLLGRFEELERQLKQSNVNRLPLQLLALGIARTEAELGWAEDLLRELDTAS